MLGYAGSYSVFNQACGSYSVFNQACGTYGVIDQACGTFTSLPQVGQVRHGLGESGDDVLCGIGSGINLQEIYSEGAEGVWHGHHLLRAWTAG